MKNLLRPSSFLTLFFLVTLITSASAQIGPPPPPGWPTSFKGKATQIHVVKFLDAQGAPMQGYIGDDTGIEYTMNGGTTWLRATITSPNNDLLSPFQTGWVNDITFKDAMNGFAVIDSNYPIGIPTPDAGILITTNGGVTWIFDDNPGTPDSGRGIYYNSNGLFVASCDAARGFVVSHDGGTTWSVIDTNNFYTGFAFNGEGVGVLATEGSACVVFPKPLRNYWLATTDGGNTWNPSAMYLESWQPLAIPTTPRFFASTEHNCAGLPEAILKSDNSGNAFAPVGGYSSSGDTLTQAMAGDGCTQFASSFVANFGMWYSADNGGTWQTMPQAPNPAPNTRFYVSPSTVWSFKQDTLYDDPRPPTPDIHFWPDTFAFRNAACAKTSDTIIHLFGCNCAHPITLVGTSVHKFNDTDSAPITIIPAIPPSGSISLCAGTAGLDTSVRLTFSPVSGNPDAADFHLTFNDNGTTFDSIVHMTANGIRANLILIPPGPITMSGPACSPTIDTCIEIFNPSCNTILINSCTINENEKDQCQLQFSGCCSLANGGVAQLIPPGGSICYPIDYQPGIIAGTNPGSFQINWQTQDGSQDSVTKLVIVTGLTTTTLRPTFRGFNINRASCCDVPTDTTIYFINTTCDTIELQKPVVYGPGSCPGNFKIDSAADPAHKIFAIHWPFKLPPPTSGSASNLGIKINLNCEGTSCTAYIKFPYKIDAYFTPTSSCAPTLDCSAFASDSLIDTLTLTTKGVVGPPKLMPNQLSFGSVNCCDASEVKTLTFTANCKSDTITGIRMNSSGHFYLISPPPSIDTVIPAGGQMTIQVGFLPQCNGGSGATDKDTIAVEFNAEGFDKDSVVSTIVATSTNFATASISADTLNYGSLRECDPQTCQTVSFTNGSCGPVVMSVSPTQNPLNAHWTTTPIGSGSVGVGDSVHDTICFNPSGTDTGAMGGIFAVEICDPGGSSCTYDTVFLNGSIIAPVASYTITPIPSATICDTTMIGEPFTFTNTGTCHTFTIVTVTTGNGQVTVTPQTATVDTGASQPFNITFLPTPGSSGTVSGVVTLTNSDGSSETVPYSFTATDCVPSGKLSVTLKPSNTIGTTPCTIGQMTFTVDANGGTGAVTGVSVLGSGRFTPNPPTSSGNMPFTGGASFDPNQIGPDSATLTINYTFNGVAGDTSIEIYGVITGALDSARIGVTSPTDSCILPNSVDTKELDVTLLDPIADSLVKTTLTVKFLINYDGNLLWNLQPVGNPPPGWTITSEIQTDSGVLVTMTYTPTGGTAGNTPLLKFKAFGAIGDSLTSTARIADLQFNDSTYEACTLKPLISKADSAVICIDTACPTNFLYLANTGHLVPVTGIQVIPNPAHKGTSAANLHFTTNIGANVTADVLDELGNAVATLTTGSLESGDHALAIPTGQMPEGTYFARITVNGYTVVRKFVLEKE